MARSAGAYPWSSARAHLGLAKAPVWLDLHQFQQMLENGAIHGHARGGTVSANEGPFAADLPLAAQGEGPKTASLTKG